MKKVHTPENVAHLWANQLQDEARNSGNSFYFIGDAIYSYGNHFQIAKHVVNAKSEKAILFTKRGYSNTTAKHKSIVRRAANHLNFIYCPDPSDSHLLNFENWGKEATSIATNLIKAKKPEIYLNKVSQLKDEAIKYAEFFNIEIPADILSILSIASAEQYMELNKLAIERAKQDELKRIAKVKKLAIKEVKEFREFKRSTVWNRAGKDYLRFNKETNRIETSQNIEIPVEIGRRFYKFVLDTIKKGGCVDNKCGQKILDYEVKEINKDYVRIGCHLIELKEIKLLAKKLGW